MKRRMRSGFTLVELLVVISIIGMLIGLLLPAINAVKETARIKQCTNNQANLAVAAIAYQTVNDRFPAYIVTIKKMKSPNQASWLVPLLGHLGQKPLSDRWYGRGSYSDEEPEREATRLEFMICPSNPTRRDKAPSAYLANRWVFDDKKRMSLDTIHDGASSTLMFSEKLLEHRWDDINENKICFRETGGIDSLSSKHDGGVVAAFCDRSTRQLRTDIDNQVFRYLVLPNDGKVLDDADFR